MTRVARVLLPLPLPEAFDYEAPGEAPLAVGDLVRAPLGSRSVVGAVEAVGERVGVNRPLRPLEGRLELPALSPSVLVFLERVARYTGQPAGEALAMTLRGLRAPAPRPERRLAEGPREPKRLTPARRAVLEALRAAGEPVTPSELRGASGSSAAVLAGLLAEGALVEVLAPRPDPFGAPDPDHAPCALNSSQDRAARALEALAGEDRFRAALLDGVTGSGKTEVYLEAAAEVLRRDPEAQVLILLPEIALTQAAVARIEARFGAAAAEWHSGVAPPRRRQVWEGVAAGRCRLVVGARSALFLPFRRLRLLVVDEEHDGSYKQEDGFIYHARDLAVLRAQTEQALVVLASATPSLETLHNAETGRYAWLRLEGRHGSAGLPEIRLVDLRAAPPERGRWISTPLRQALAETAARGEQSLLFLNRRGYAPVVLCRACGERMTAPDTQSWLVEHRYLNRLVCHLTGWWTPKPEACPTCGTPGALVSVGPGVERLEEEVRELFPDLAVAVFSSDTAPTADLARDLVGRMAAGEIDVLIATQAAAKGHNFPRLTLVGVVDADLGLRGGDLRAAERTFQLLAQATGRAGRAERPGRALIQTYEPDHPVMRALEAGDRDAFLAAERDMRRDAGLPPFARLAALILSSRDAERLEAEARAFAAAAPNAEGVDVYGPVDAPVALLRGVRRKRLLVRADRGVDLNAFLAAWRARARLPGAVRLVVDVDPYSFF